MGSSSGLQFKVGDEVSGQFRDGRWYPAKISAVQGGKYVLDWADGRIEDRLKEAAYVRAVAGASVPAGVSAGRAAAAPAVVTGATAAVSGAASGSSSGLQFKVGDEVSGQFRDGRWYPAKVSAVQGGKYVLDWADGRIEDRLKEAAYVRSATGLRSESVLSDSADLPVAKRSALKAASAVSASSPSAVPLTLAAPAAPSFRVGDQVEGRTQDGVWFPATVVAIRQDGRFSIAWSDGNVLDAVKGAGELRVPAGAGAAGASRPGVAQSLVFAPYQAGDAVRAQFRDGLWYPARIAAVQADGSFLLDWAPVAQGGPPLGGSAPLPEADRLRPREGLQPAELTCIVSRMEIASGQKYVLTAHGPVLMAFMDRYRQMVKDLDDFQEG